MDRRLVLNELLVTILGNEDRVYFQPPANVQMAYPAILYERDSELARFADNGPYRRTWRYTVTIIDRNPDSIYIEKIADLPLTNFSRHYVVDGLNHDVYTLYF